MAEDSISRRKFLTAGIGVISGTIIVGLGGAAIVSIGAPAVTNKQEGKWVDAGNVAELPAGQFNQVNLAYDAKDGWMDGKFKMLAYVKVEGENVSAFSATCSHLGCNVNYDETTGGFKCPCHTGMYDKNGKNVGGPPPKPLKKLEAKIENGKLMLNTLPKEA
jgi:Rieske Fe-S protein